MVLLHVEDGEIPLLVILSKNIITSVALFGAFFYGEFMNFFDFLALVYFISFLTSHPVIAILSLVGISLPALTVILMRFW